MLLCKSAGSLLLPPPEPEVRHRHRLPGLPLSSRLAEALLWLVPDKMGSVGDPCAACVLLLLFSACVRMPLLVHLAAAVACPVLSSDLWLLSSFDSQVGEPIVHCLSPAFVPWCSISCRCA